MGKQISNGLKYTFLVHCIVGIVFGITYLLFLDTYASIVQWPLRENLPYQLVGAALMGFGASSWFAFKDPVWESVRIIVIMEIVWCGIGAVVMAWGLTSQGYPPIGWMNFAILALFTIAFAYFYMREKA